MSTSRQAAGGRPPLISVIVPVYNAEAWVAAAVESALAAHPDLEVVLVEDASPDGSLAVCRRLVAEHGRVRLHRHPDGQNRGAGASRNRGIRRARGEYIAFLDADDYYLPNRFQVDVPMLEADAGTDGVYGAAVTRREDGERVAPTHGRDLITVSEPIKPDELFSALLAGDRGWCHIDGLTVRRRVFDRVGFFAHHLLTEDWEMWIRLASMCRLEPGSITEPVAVRRWHADNRAVQANPRWWQEGCARTLSALRWAHRVGLAAARQRELREHLVVDVVHRRVAGRTLPARVLYVARRTLRHGLQHPWLLPFVAAEVSREVLRRLHGDRRPALRPEDRQDGGTTPLTVCVARLQPVERFGTFVQAHVERLPARIELLCDTWLTRDGSGRRAGPPPWVRRALRGVRRLTGLPLDECLRRRAFARFLRQRGIDVVLAEFGPAGALLAGACEAAGVPLVVHFHGYDAYRETIIRTWGGAYRRMFGKAAAVIAVSHAMEQQLAGLGALPDRIRYNPYGVDCALFQPTDPEANPPLFVAVGRFVTKKAPNLTIRAFARARESCGDCRLTMAGNGPLLEQCRDLARDLGVGDAIEFTGSLPHAEVAALMARGRAFVQHSVTAPDGDAEGTPVAILEAGAVGLPVVATRHAGIPDVVVEGENGLLVDEGDVEAMAAHMLSLARDPALAGRLGRAARERVSTRFSMERSIGRLHEILLEAGRR